MRVNANAARSAALQNVSFRVRSGEVLALAGDNGAGKSTLIKVISGVYRPDTGNIHFRGRPIAMATPREARDIGIETIYQDLPLSDNLDVGSNVFLGREPTIRRFAFLPAIDRAFMRQVAYALLKRLDIDIEARKLQRPVGELSGGQRQGVGIARALYWNASLLIMDEPTAALGVPEQRKVRALVKRLKHENAAVIFISHNLGDIFDVADRVMVLRRGIVVGERKTNETDGDEIVKMMVGG